MGRISEHWGYCTLGRTCVIMDDTEEPLETSRAYELAQQYAKTHVPVLLFRSDGHRRVVVADTTRLSDSTQKQIVKDNFAVTFVETGKK